MQDILGVVIYHEIGWLRSLFTPPDLYFAMNSSSMLLLTNKYSEIYFLGIPFNKARIQIAFRLNLNGLFKMQSSGMRKRNI